MEKQKSLKTRFIIIICIVTLLIVATLSIIIIFTAVRSQSEQTAIFIESLLSAQEQDKELFRQGLYQKVESLAALLAQTASLQIVDYNFEFLQQLAENVIHDPEIDFVTFYEEDEQALTTETEQQENIETIRQEIIYEETLVGFVKIGFNFKAMDRVAADVSKRVEKLMGQAKARKAESIRTFLLRAVISATSGILLLSFVIYSSLSNLIIKPLFRVSEIARKLAVYDLTVNLDITRQDEVGTLFMAINEMVRSFKNVISQVQHSGIQVASSSTELSATAREQEATMTTQVESTNQVVLSTQNISAVAANLVMTMQHVASMSHETAQFADSGQRNLSRLEEAMRNMEGASRTISGRLEAINEKADNITTVVTTINRVADQTNLLSLNAAIEAEKAGEYGRGFTIVAREIRRLADQTAMATLDIGQMVQGMQSAVLAGVTEMDKFIADVRQSAEDVGEISMQLTRIIAQVQALAPNFEEVNMAMGEQSENAQKISAAVAYLSEEMWQTKESLHETYSVIEQLNEAAESLQNEVSRFKVG